MRCRGAPEGHIPHGDCIPLRTSLHLLVFALRVEAQQILWPLEATKPLTLPLTVQAPFALFLEWRWFEGCKYSSAKVAATNHSTRVRGGLHRTSFDFDLAGVLEVAKSLRSVRFSELEQAARLLMASKGSDRWPSGQVR